MLRRIFENLRLDLRRSNAAPAGAAKLDKVLADQQAACIRDFLQTTSGEIGYWLPPDTPPLAGYKPGYRALLFHAA